MNYCETNSKRIENTSLFKFIKYVNTKHSEKIKNFEDLHKWSVENRNYFGMKFGTFIML